MRVIHKASDVRLSIVGKRPFLSKPSLPLPTSLNITSRGLLEDETEPLQPQPAKSAQKRFSAIQDPRASRFSHAKILLMEKNLLTLTLLVLFLGMIEVEVEREGLIAQRMLMVLDLTTIFLILLIFLRKLALFELQADQRRLYLPRKQRNDNPDYLRLMLSNRKYIWELFWEILIALPHPSLLLYRRYYSFYSEVHQRILLYSINDLMGVFMLLKVALILRAIIGLSIYATPRAVRTCHYSGILHDSLFVAKCLQKEHPLRCTATIFSLSLLIFGYGFRVTEGQVSVLNGLPSNGFQSLPNCYWAAFITMATIGYGDYIPSTSLNQFLAVVLAIFGVVLNSQLIMALTDYLRMKTSQARSHTVLFRLHQQDLLKQEATTALAESVRLSRLMSKHQIDPLVGPRLRPCFQALRGSIQVTKAHQKKIKAIVPSETITEQMIRSFELLKDNFKDIYTMQKKLKKKIQQMEARQDFRHEEMRRTFIDEVSNIMHKVYR